MDIVMHASTPEEMREEVLTYIENRFRGQHRAIAIYRLERDRRSARAIAEVLRGIANDLRAVRIEPKP